MIDKIYRFYGLDTAMDLLRPNAKWEISSGDGNICFTKWDDPRPCPTIEEVLNMMEKIKKFEDSFECIWLPEDEKKIREYNSNVCGIK